EAPLEHEGKHYKIPYEGDNATGLGKPLKSIIHGRADMPIYIAAIGPKNVTLTAEVADGWLPIFFSPERYPETFKAYVDEGFEKAGNGKSIANFDIAPSVAVVLGDDLSECYNQLKPMLALYVGGMGAKNKNFYNDLARRYGFEAEAENIQNLYLSGKKMEAIVAVPDEMVDAVALVGDRARIKDRLQLWTDSDITTFNIMNPAEDIEVIRYMAELVL
ncbi:MAG: LLM class flavin-dependent oxidoreductase, partial [Aggregatilineales bacterium]